MSDIKLQFYELVKQIKSYISTRSYTSKFEENNNKNQTSSHNAQRNDVTSSNLLKMADTASANSSKNTSADVNSVTEGCDIMPGGSNEGRVSTKKRPWDDMECFSASQAKRSYQDGFQVSDNWAPRGGKTVHTWI